MPYRRHEFHFLLTAGREGNEGVVKPIGRHGRVVGKICLQGVPRREGKVPNVVVVDPVVPVQVEIRKNREGPVGQGTQQQRRVGRGQAASS